MRNHRFTVGCLTVRPNSQRRGPQDFHLLYFCFLTAFAISQSLDPRNYRNIFLLLKEEMMMSPYFFEYVSLLRMASETIASFHWAT